MTTPRNCWAAAATRRSTTGTRTARGFRLPTVRCPSRGGPARPSRANWTGSSGATARCFRSPTSRPRSGCRPAAAPSWPSPTSKTVCARNEVLREHDAELRVREGALRRIASLVAGGAASSEVFAAIAREVGRVIGLPMVALWRYEADATATVIGVLGGASASVPGRHALAAGRPDDLRQSPGDRPAGEDRRLRRRAAARSPTPPVGPGSVRAPAPRSSSTATSGARCRPTRSTPLPLPDRDRGAARRVHGAGRHGGRQQREPGAARHLAEEQAALRRVATLVARQSPPAEIFAAVAEEVGRLLRVEDTTIFRYEDDGTATVVADRGDRAVPLPIGSRMSWRATARPRSCVAPAGRRGSTTSRTPPGRSPTTRATRASAPPSAVRSWSTDGSGAR